MAFIWRLLCATEDIPEDTCSYKGSLSQTLWRFDSIGFKEVTKV